MTQATVNGQVFEIDLDANNIVMNGKAFDWDVSELGEARFHIIKDHKSYNAEIVLTDDKSVSIKINNNIYDIHVKNKLDLLLEKLGMDNLNIQVENDIKAPMPGLIFNILVKEGDEVKKGDQVLILEAMKMENVIKSPTDGVITRIHVAKGESVEKNTILISF